MTSQKHHPVSGNALMGRVRTTSRTTIQLVCLVYCIILSLLLFRKFCKYKYAYTTLLFLCKIFANLSKSEAFHFLHKQFASLIRREIKGKHPPPPPPHFPLDLMMEFFNHILKYCLRMLGRNINEKSAQITAWF